MIKLAICDDDKKFLADVKNIIDNERIKSGDRLIVHYYSSGEKLLHNIIEKHMEYNVVITDIYIDKISGFDIADKINEINANTYIIFITSDIGIVYDCFGYRPFDFIRKDMYDKRIPQVIENVIDEIMLHDIWELKTDGCVKQLPYREIYYIQRIDRKVVINTSHESISTQLKLNEIEDSLKVHDFIRIHRKNIVNMKYIQDIDVGKDEIILKDKRRLEMSRYRKIEIIEQYKKYLRKR